MWQYTQGLWRSCDAAAELADEEGNLDEDETAKECGTDPAPIIFHSVGMLGFYAWIDLTNQLFGVFVRQRVNTHTTCHPHSLSPPSAIYAHARRCTAGHMTLTVYTGSTSL